MWRIEVPVLRSVLSEIYYLYILHSDSLDQFDVGVSHDPDARLVYHNSSKKGWTRRGRAWRLVFKHEFPNRSEAQKAKRFVKAQWSTAFIRKVISGAFTLDNF